MQSGKLKALAVTGTRHAALPDVPAFSETPFPGMNARSWFGLFAPAGTPPLSSRSLRRPLFRAWLTPLSRSGSKGLGADPVGDDRATFQKYVNDEVARWAVLVAQSGATAE